MRRTEDGAFYSGQRRQLTGTLSVRPHRGWLINVGGDFNEISLREGRFTTRVWLNDVNTQFNPFISLVNRLQFDTVTRQLGWQSRFRWITRPGNDIFFVYTHNWTDRTTLQTFDRKGSIKSSGRSGSQRGQTPVMTVRGSDPGDGATQGCRIAYLRRLQMRGAALAHEAPAGDLRVRMDANVGE